MADTRYGFHRSSEQVYVSYEWAGTTVSAAVAVLSSHLRHRSFNTVRFGLKGQKVLFFCPYRSSTGDSSDGTHTVHGWWLVKG